MRRVRPTGGHPGAGGDLGRTDPKTCPCQRIPEGLRGQTSPTWARAERASPGSEVPPAVGCPAAPGDVLGGRGWVITAGPSHNSYRTDTDLSSYV